MMRLERSEQKHCRIAQTRQLMKVKIEKRKSAKIVTLNSDDRKLELLKNIVAERQDNERQKMEGNFEDLNLPLQLALDRKEKVMRDRSLG